MTYLLYRRPYPPAACHANHEVPVFEAPWEREYVGCSPLHDPLGSDGSVPGWLAVSFD